MSPLLTPEDVAELRALSEEFRDACDGSERSGSVAQTLLEADLGDRWQEALLSAAPSLLKAAELLPLLAEALEWVAKGAGPFSRDPLTHASNTIDSMKEIARAALEAYRLALGEAKE